MSTWDMARLASKRPLPKKRKPIGPVGSADELIKKIVAGEIPAPDWKGCRACGYHVCSCERPKWQRTPALGHLDTLPPEQQTTGDHIAKRRAEALPGSRLDLASALAEQFDERKRKQAIDLIISGEFKHDYRVDLYGGIKVVVDPNLPPGAWHFK